MNSQERILIIFLRLLSGKEITKRELMEEFNKTESTIQRDIGYIEKILFDDRFNLILPSTVNIERDRKGNYQLKHIENYSDFSRLTDMDILVLLKILYSTTIFNVNEMSNLSEKLLAIAEDKERLKNFIRNESTFYKGIATENLMDRLEMLAEGIINNQLIEFSYTKNGVTKIFQRLPNAIYFSDLYFFLISSSHTSQDDRDFSELNKFRINNMKNIKIVSSYNKLDYKNRFEGGILRNQTALPFFGKPIVIVLDCYYEPAYVLDRFPNSKIIQKNDDESLRIQIEANDGYGVKMWLLSQRDMVKVISPKHIRDFVIQDMKNTLKLYDVKI